MRTGDTVDPGCGPGIPGIKPDQMLTLALSLHLVDLCVLPHVSVWVLIPIPPGFHVTRFFFFLAKSSQSYHVQYISALFSGFSTEYIILNYGIIL